MKKYIILLAICLLGASCSFLEVPLESSISTSNFYQTAEEFDLGLTGVYETLINRDGNGGSRYGSYFEGFMCITRVGTDEMLCRYAAAHGESTIADYSYTSSNDYIEDTWLMMYKGIQRANIIISRLEPKDIGNESEKNRILGEAYFLRSFFYFNLVRIYGEVPISEKEIVDLSEMDLTRREIADVYSVIVEGLKKAESYLPETNANGRPCSNTAKAMLGEVYLQMSGEPLNNTQAAALAKDKLNEVIQSGRYELVTDFFSQFDGKHEYNSEYIWDIEFANNGNTKYGGQVGTTEGVPNPASLYWVRFASCKEFYETFDPNDLRRNCIARFQYKYDAQQNLIEVPYEGDPETDYFYFAYKFRHALTAEGRGSGWANWSNPINYPIIRYADVLLMYAEAELRSGGLSSQGLECVNMVRRRGFGYPYGKPESSCDLSTVTLDDILAERSFELCFEGHRWFDLVRFGKLEEGVKKLSKYEVTTRYTQQAVNFKEKHKFFPIPQDVIDASNGVLKQNRGWAVE